MSSNEINPKAMGMVVAFCDSDRGYALGRNLPWPFIKQDYDFYMKVITDTEDPDKKNGVLKGRLCWETSPEDDQHPKMKIVVTSNSVKDDKPLIKVVTNYNDAIDYMLQGVKDGQLENIWILGGGQNYIEAMKDKRFNLIHVTRVFKDFPTDCWFPEFEHLFEKTSTSERFTDPTNGIEYQFEEWMRKEENDQPEIDNQ